MILLNFGLKILGSESRQDKERKKSSKNWGEKIDFEDGMIIYTEKPRDCVNN